MTDSFLNLELHHPIPITYLDEDTLGDPKKCLFKTTHCFDIAIKTAEELRDEIIGLFRFWYSVFRFVLSRGEETQWFLNKEIRNEVRNTRAKKFVQLIWRLLCRSSVEFYIRNLIHRDQEWMSSTRRDDTDYVFFYKRILFIRKIM